jgi:hypothetical protein
MNKEPSAVQELVGDLAPKLVELTEGVLFGDVWEPAALQARSEPRNHSCPDYDESARPVAISSELRCAERGKEGRID